MTSDVAESLTDYLCVEPFLHDALSGRMLHVALTSGAIDLLASSDDVTRKLIARTTSFDALGVMLLVRTLVATGVLQTRDDRIALTPAFRAALRYRDLLETRLEFATLLTADYFARLPQLLRSADDFLSGATLFDVFDYSRSFDVTPENCAFAARWMKLTTVLTRYEAPVCHRAFPFANHRRLLDAGGNSGEFAVQILKREPQLTATICDLPVVCEVGRAHVAPQPEASRITFQPLNFLTDAVPPGHDLITFKSVLHDWPDDAIEHIVGNAVAALPPGGRLLIFERQACAHALSRISWGQLPVLLFIRSYRAPEFYETLLRRLGLIEVRTQTIELETPFMLVCGSKP